VAQDLPDDLIGAAVIGFGASLLGRQSEQAAGLVVLQELVVALAAEAVLLDHVEDMVLQALTLQQHEEAVSHLIGSGHGQVADGADELVGVEIELQRCIHERRIAARGGYVSNQIWQSQ